MKKLIAIIVLSLIATGNAIYLTIAAYSINAGEKVFGSQGVSGAICDINSTFSCSSVFSNDFSWIFGIIPFSLIAAIVYPVIIIVALLGIFGKIKNPFKILFLIGIGGLLFNSYIIYNEYMIGAYCLLCLICTLIIIGILILSKIGCMNYKKSILK